MATTTQGKPKRPSLFRDPADWAADNGWISRRRAVNIAAKIEAVAVAVEDALNGEGGDLWAAELRAIGKTLAPAKTPAERKLARERRA